MLGHRLVGRLRTAEPERVVLQPGVLLLAGIGAGGLGVALAFDHPGLSQLFFLMGALPYLGILAVYGLLILLRETRAPAVAVALAVAAGTAAAFAIPALGGVTVPVDPGRPVAVLFQPYAVLLAGAALAVAVLAATAGVRRACALAVVALMALSVPGNLHERLTLLAERVEKGGLHQGPKPASAQVMPPDALTVLRWLRARSRPGTWSPRTSTASGGSRRRATTSVSGCPRSPNDASCSRGGRTRRRT
nr:hypothetical protein GCM10020093_089440 [Planobispora longispora]